MTSQDFNEKRLEPRFPIGAKVTLTSNNSGDTLSGTCCNVSASGVLIKTMQPLVSGEKYTLHISEGVVDFVSEAEAMHQNPDGDGYITGFKAADPA